jgi:hypothetical protein
MSSATGSGIFPSCTSFLEEILPRKNFFDDCEVEHKFESIGQRTMQLNARRLDHMTLGPDHGYDHSRVDHQCRQIRRT